MALPAGRILSRQRTNLRGLAASIVIALTALLILSTSAHAGTRYAPVDRAGPPLGVATSRLAQALRCTAGVTSSARSPILLVPGTTVTPEEFAWNWKRALDDAAWPYCTITLPGNSMGDVQVAGEYVVYAIRTMHRLSGRKIDLLGHSQGGMVPRWALRFWPDTRSMVDDVVGMSPSNHGTQTAIALCAVGCAPAIWQQRSNASFIAALNSSQETFPGISYTNIYSHTDEVVVPNSSDQGSSSLHGGGGQIANVAIQQICPLDLAEHLAVGTYDNVTYAVAIDAFTHPGPADPQRVSRAVCARLLMPGVDPLTFATDFAATGAVLARTLLTYPHVPSEPPLACYVTASCASPSRRSAVRRHKHLHHRAARRRIWRR